MQLFQLKKTIKTGQCEAMRCQDDVSGEVTSMLWGESVGELRRVKLCQRHHAMAVSWADKQGVPLGEDERPAEVLGPDHPLMLQIRENEGAKLVGFSEENGAKKWLARVYEIVQELQESFTDGKEVVEIIKGLAVNTHEDLEQIATFAKDVKAQVKLVVELEKEATGPLATALARLRDAIKPTKTIWADAEKLLRAHLEAAALRQEERNKKAQEEATALAAAGDDPTGALASMTHVSDLDGISLKIRWKAVVRDAKLMPDEYVIRIPNEKKLKEYCAGFEGEPDPMPGVEFERDVDSRIQATKPT